MPTRRGQAASDDPHAGDRLVTLRDGTRVRLRSIRPDDAPRLIALSRRLSPRTLYQRFFSVRTLRPEDAAALAAVDGRSHVAIVADRGPGQPDDLIAVARYGVAPDAPTPDVALVVDDAWQGRGLGTILLNAILDAGEAQGFVTFRADILADNRRMLRLLGRSGVILERSAEHGVVALRFCRRADALGASRRDEGSASQPAVDRPVRVA